MPFNLSFGVQWLKPALQVRGVTRDIRGSCASPALACERDTGRGCWTGRWPGRWRQTNGGKSWTAAPPGRQSRWSDTPAACSSASAARTTQSTSPVWERALLYLLLGARVARQTGKPRTYHDLGQDEHDDVGRLVARYCVEELEGEKDWSLNQKSRNVGLWQENSHEMILPLWGWSADRGLMWRLLCPPRWMRCVGTKTSPVGRKKKVKGTETWQNGNIETCRSTNPPAACQCRKSSQSLAGSLLRNKGREVIKSSLSSLRDGDALRRECERATRLVRVDLTSNWMPK